MFKHDSKSCIISQREVGRDTHSFLTALRASLREDPDVILVGELRDLETMEAAITAAETGHLVFGTLHTTGAAKTVAKAIPELEGKLDGMAMRVPTPVVSITDFVCTMKKAASVEEINELFKGKAKGELKGILDVSEEELVSMDFKGNSNSSIVDLPLTMSLVN